jgi:radical SAM-linked protein
MYAATSPSTSCWGVLLVADGEFRLRVRYGKVGRLRWLSHLEVIHSLERSIRRAGLPYAITRGFSPHMKVAFGPALPVGTAGDNEYLDVWLTRYTDAREALSLLQGSTPADLAPLEARYVADKEPSLTAAITIATYVVDVVGKESSAKHVRTALDGVVGTGTLSVEHKGKNKVFDLARSLPKEVRVDDRQDGSSIELAIRMGPEGSLRPELLVREALRAASLDAAVSHTTRTDTLVETDEGVWSRPV